MERPFAGNDVSVAPLFSTPPSPSAHPLSYRPRSASDATGPSIRREPLSLSPLSRPSSRYSRRPSNSSSPSTASVSPSIFSPSRCMGFTPEGPLPATAQHVVIVGAGLAGVSVATTLARRLGSRTPAHITLIDPRNYVEIRWAVIRGLFDESVAKAATVALSDILDAYPTIAHIRTRAIALDHNSVTLCDGTVLPFNACLLSTGCVPDYAVLSAPHPHVYARRAQLATEGDKLKHAPSVLIVGGGPVGAELAGHLAANARSMGRAPRVTLVHDRERLAEPLGPRAAGRLAEQLALLGVDVILAEPAERQGDEWVVKSTGRALTGDVVITSTGVKPTTGGAGALLRGMKGLADRVDNKGWVRTDRNGRVSGNIFALGDCTDQPFKSTLTVLANRKNMAHNLRLVLEAGVAAKKGVSSANYEKRMRAMQSPSSSSMTVLAGPAAGVVQTRLFTDGTLLPRLRSRMFLSLSKARSDLGL